MPETSTHLEEKLKITAKQIEKFAILMMIISIITHIIYLVIYIPSNDQKFFSFMSLRELA